MSDYNFNFEYVNAGAPIVTLSALGIAFNQLSRSLLGYPELINIGFDEEKLTIGIKPHNPQSKIKSYEFEKKEKNGWVRIGCRDFSRHLSKISNIDFISKAQQFIASYDDEQKMLIVIVDNEHLKK
ncbi:hypothetical protein [Hydrogenoanaerobacterium sp.]|uniref:hypothetical protein n=1 Tax=Hydrogenoanaerobacterium sp. TaxID=2953763 RepID=UPI0028A2B47B|nr:hypothetical protein [Hydrogenoanaerobacterium sp.]